MLKIVICDDNISESKTIENLTNDFFNENSIPVEIDIFNDPKLLLSSKKEYDIYLLDVIMPELTGIDVAARIGGHKHSVVFITSSVESAVDGYSVNAEGFILKPVTKKSYTDTMKRIIKKNAFDTNQYITITYNRVPVNIKPDNIMYLEARLHNVYLHIKGEKVLTVKGKLSDFQEELKSYSQFLRCHQSYIVNMSSIESMKESDFIIKDGSIIPISRSFYKECKRSYYHYRLM